MKNSKSLFLIFHSLNLKDVVRLKIKLSFQLLSAIANDVRVNKYNIIVYLKFINN